MLTTNQLIESAHAPSPNDARREDFQRYAARYALAQAEVDNLRHANHELRNNRQALREEIVCLNRELKISQRNELFWKYFAAAVTTFSVIVCGALGYYRP